MAQFLSSSKFMQMEVNCKEAPPWKKKILKFSGILRSLRRSDYAFSAIETKALPLWDISMTLMPVPL